MAAAQSYAKSKKLTLKVTKEASDSVDEGKIISTSPAAGSQVSAGDTLEVVVSTGAETEEVKKTYTVEYQASDDGSSASSSDDSSSSSSSSASSSSKDKGNHVQIYIQDDDHSIGNIYRDQYITKDTDFTITFPLRTTLARSRLSEMGKRS